MTRTRGFTMMEVVVAVALLVPFLLVALHELASTSRATADYTTSATELMLAARMSERFREDVMQARAMGIPQPGEVWMRHAGGDVRWRIADGRVEREFGGEVLRGPRVTGVDYGIDWAMLHATWHCGGRDLVLDTFSRALEPR